MTYKLAVRSASVLNVTITHSPGPMPLLCQPSHHGEAARRWVEAESQTYCDAEQKVLASGGGSVHLIRKCTVDGTLLLWEWMPTLTGLGPEFSLILFPAVSIFCLLARIHEEDFSSQGRWRSQGHLQIQLKMREDGHDWGKKERKRSKTTAQLTREFK